MPPEQENKPLTWPYWPIKLRTSSSHEEGCEREFAIATKEFVGEKGKVKPRPEDGARGVEGRQDGRGAGSEQMLKADLVLPGDGLRAPGAARCWRRSASRRTRAATPRRAPTSTGGYATNVPKVFAAGDMRRGQSLVVWAIREGRAGRALGGRDS